MMQVAGRCVAAAATPGAPRSPSATGPSPVAGFSLLEVLVAVTVSGAVLVVILAGFGVNLRATGVAEGYAVAVMLGQQVITEFENGLVLPALQGDFGNDYPAYRWVAELRELETESSEPVFAVTVRVLFMRAGQERAQVIETVLPPERPAQ